MATQAKVLIEFEEAAWRRQKLSGRVASRVGPLVEVHDHCSADMKQAALFGFLGFSPTELQEINVEEAIEHQISRCFGYDIAKLITGILVRDWSQYPTICARLDAELPPQHPTVLPEGIRQAEECSNVFFAVAETAFRSPGLIDGALESGRRAALQALAR